MYQECNGHSDRATPTKQHHNTNQQTQGWRRLLLRAPVVSPNDTEGHWQQPLLVVLSCLFVVILRLLPTSYEDKVGIIMNQLGQYHMTSADIALTWLISLWHRLISIEVDETKFDWTINSAEKIQPLIGRPIRNSANQNAEKKSALYEFRLFPYFGCHFENA